MYFDGIDAPHLAVEDGNSFRRERIKSVMIDALIADVGTNGQLCLRHRLIVSREPELYFGNVAVSKKSQPLVSVETCGFVINSELDLSRPSGPIDRCVPFFRFPPVNLLIPP